MPFLKIYAAKLFGGLLKNKAGVGAKRQLTWRVALVLLGAAVLFLIVHWINPTAAALFLQALIVLF